MSLVGNNFDSVYAFGLGGNDAATFTGSSDNEVFYGLGGYGYSVVNNTVFLQYLIGFSQTTVNAGTGNDGAIFFDAGGNDTFTANPNTASMSAPASSTRPTASIRCSPSPAAAATTRPISTAPMPMTFSPATPPYVALFRPGAYLLAGLQLRAGQRAAIFLIRQ